MKLSGQIRMVIADDHPMFREGLRTTIARSPEYLIVAEAADGASALGAIDTHAPDLAILDIEMPGLTGIDVAQRLYERNDPVRVLILTLYSEYGLFNRAIDVGVRGYILKESAVLDILHGIAAVVRGEYYFSPSLVQYLAERSVPDRRSQGNAHPQASLTATEREVLRLIGESLSSRDIADRLCVSVRTVETHRYNIAHKLGLNGSYALLRYALAHRTQP